MNSIDDWPENEKQILITDSNQSLFQVQVWGKPDREEEDRLLQNRGWEDPSAVKQLGLLEARCWLLARCFDWLSEGKLLTIYSSGQDDIGQIEEGHLTALPPKWPKCLWPPGSPRPPWPPWPLEPPNHLTTSSGKNASGHSACFSGRSGQSTACWGNTSHVKHCQPKVWVHIFEPYLTVLFHF